MHFVKFVEVVIVDVHYVAVVRVIFLPKAPVGSGALIRQSVNAADGDGIPREHTDSWGPCTTPVGAASSFSPVEENTATRLGPTLICTLLQCVMVAQLFFVATALRLSFHENRDC